MHVKNDTMTDVLNIKKGFNLSDDIAELQMSTVNRLVSNSQEAFRKYAALTLNHRKEIIENIRKGLNPIIDDMALKEFEETGMGVINDKSIKLYYAIYKTPGVEDLITEVQTGDDGMTLYEYSAYGVVCAIQPATNPCATIINNTISMLAAGNSIIHIPHPRCIKVSNFVIKKINRIIYDSCGIEHLVDVVEKSSMILADEIINHPDVSMVVATGGQKMLNHALTSPKRVIGAGPANPVVIVDETADIEKAAKDIVAGASFDNNIMCITEKSIVIVSSIMSQFVESLKKQGVYYVNNELEMIKLTKATLNNDMKMNREMEGKHANYILQQAGIQCNRQIRLIVVNTIKKHPFATEELLMPLIPLIVVETFDEALETALFIEQDFRHTAMIHSQFILNLNKAAHIMQTAIFIKNGSSLLGLGFNGEEKTSFTIANITGEGMTTARNFARRRRCTLTSGFSIR